MDFKKVIDIVNSLLITYGFGKHRYTFTRELGAFIQIIEVQKFSFTVKEKEAFTINIGFVHPHAFKAVFKRNPECRYTADGVLDFRISQLLTDFKPKPLEKYWLLDNEDAVKSELESILIEKVIPFLDTMQTEKQIIDFMESYPHVFISTLAIKMQLEELKKHASS